MASIADCWNRKLYLIALPMSRTQRRLRQRAAGAGHGGTWTKRGGLATVNDLKWLRLFPALNSASRRSLCSPSVLRRASQPARRLAHNKGAMTTMHACFASGPGEVRCIVGIVVGAVGDRGHNWLRYKCGHARNIKNQFPNSNKKVRRQVELNAKCA